MRLVPAILTSSPQRLEEMLRQAGGFTDRVQIDIMDGRFVPSLSITAQDLARVKDRLWKEVHLMVQDPQEHLEPFLRAGASRIVFHYEATPTPEEVIARGRALGISLGLALNPATPLEEVKPLLGLVDFLLLLSVDPGFYGSPFQPSVLEKAREVRAWLPALELGMDGGLKADNIGLVKKAGVDYACVGSAIFQSPDPEKSFGALRALAQEVT